MPERDVVEVYRAKSGFQARMFAGVLEEAGIPAQIQGQIFHPGSQTSGNALGAAVEWWDAPRILVFADDADRAKRVLLELEEQERSKSQPAGEAPSVDVECEECGQRTTFPAAQRGTVQNCSQCGAYVDVGEDDSQDDELGEAEAEPSAD